MNAGSNSREPVTVAGDNRKTVEQFIDRVVAGRDMTCIEEVCTESVACRMPIGAADGPDAMRAVLDAIFRAFPDFRIKTEYTVAENDHVAVRVTMRATLSGEFEGREPNGRRLVLPQLWMFRLAAGRISGLDVIYDNRIVADMLGARQSMSRSSL